MLDVGNVSFHVVVKEVANGFCFVSAPNKCRRTQQQGAQPSDTNTQSERRNAQTAVLIRPEQPTYRTPPAKPLTLLLRHTNGATPSAGGLAVLTTHAQTPVVSETTVSADLLETLQVLAELAVDAVGEDLAVLAVDDVALSVEEPAGDLVLRGVLDDGDDTFEFFGGEFTGAEEG